MKRILLTLAVVLVSIGFTNAQAEEGHITYKISIESDDAAIASMMEGSTFEIFFKGEKSRIDMSMGMMFSMVTITDGKDILMLMGGMMGKKAVLTSKKDLEKDLEKEGKEPDVDVKFVSGKKKVAGYDCKKAIIMDGDGNEIVYWYTEKLKLADPGQSNAQGNIPGIALAFEMDRQGMVMSYIATSVEESIKDKSLFKMVIPDGYEKMTMEEMKSMGM